MVRLLKRSTGALALALFYSASTILAAPASGSSSYPVVNIDGGESTEGATTVTQIVSGDSNTLTETGK